jgi:drug/metabolite transporter (DMT)-like permease
MSAGVFLAVLGAALLHAVWNALVKGGSDKHLGMCAVVLGQMIYAVICTPFAPMPAAESWPYLVAGVGLHVGYQFFLLHSYRSGDLTQVYPIARGTAPLIVAGVSVLFLGVVLQPIEILAVATIGAGILSMSLVRQKDGLRNAHAARLALGTGCFIAAYSLVDGFGARVAGTSLGFYAWLATFNGIAFAVITAMTSPKRLFDAVTSAKFVLLVGGGASFCAYAIVVWAFTQAPIALVTALRETSIIFALLIGVGLMKERMDLVKVVSTMTTLFGAALLRFAKH